MKKSPNEMTLSERKIDLINEMYLSRADEDYIAARWAYGNGLFHSFYWSSAQAFEKYMKSIILFQGISVKKYSHDLLNLYEAILEYDRNNCLPKVIDLPDTTAMGHEAWQGKDLSLFVDYLQAYGDPDNRYATIGTFINGPVIHILDSVCAAFRRYICTTNFLNLDLFDFNRQYRLPQEPDCDRKQWMIDQDLLLERLYCHRYNVGQSVSTRRYFSNMNLAFFDTREEDESTFGGFHFHGSPLYNHLVRIKSVDLSEENYIIVDELREWSQENIKMSKAVLRQLGF